MKICAGCGKHYDEAQTTCPACWSRSWVIAPEGNAPVELPANPNPCPECGYYASAGVANCPHCHQRLRPRALEWLTILGLIGSPLLLLYYSFILIKQHNIASLSNIPDILICAAATWVCWGILQGEYTAFKAMRKLIIAAAILQLVLVVLCQLLHEDQLAANLGTSLVFRLIGGAAIWVISLNQAIQDYCSLGKPKEQYVAKEVFLEQTHASKTERLGSSITRNF